MVQHQLRGIVNITDGCSFSLHNFGFATSVQTMDPCNSSVGTISYMSPERIKTDLNDGAERINTDLNDGAYNRYADDIWSFGLSVLEFYLGKFPFGENLRGQGDWASLMCAIFFSNPPQASATTLREFRSFIVCCLQKEPDETFGNIVEGHFVTLQIVNKCPFPIWPATAPNAGHPVIASGGFFLPSGQAKVIQAPATWSGRLWARTDCNFRSNFNCACKTGDCQGLLSCNGAIGLPPATLVEVSLQEGKPSFYDISIVDGYNLPISVSTKPFDSKCLIKGCIKDINALCPQELQLLDEDDNAVIACKSACLAFNLDVFCCRNEYGKPESCRPSLYSDMFKDACPSYVSYAYDSPPPLVSCSCKDFVVTFCPSSKWGSDLSM
ncbi:uncharacterized protein A4U43_C03F27850 [Asparagus officinalis]|uniref:Protein kinase domain-containing protein n=1 Tax=Asparagus officinalis TaxID=4686 RepID=A0A5P1FEE4_ASPOF|nr:uncharacterized protein A4U43_C03F27850 [Asparagus officinalis]